MIIIGHTIISDIAIIFISIIITYYSYQIYLTINTQISIISILYYSIVSIIYHSIISITLTSITSY